jgi:hypothetical protein
MKATNYKEGSMQEKALRVLSLFALLKYGLSGVVELGRPLSSEEILQVCSERRLVTTHLGSGFFLPYPLTADIRVGHVILDDIRHYFWQHAADQEQRLRKIVGIRGLPTGNCRQLASLSKHWLLQCMDRQKESSLAGQKLKGHSSIPGVFLIKESSPVPGIPYCQVLFKNIS